MHQGGIWFARLEEHESSNYYLLTRVYLMDWGYILSAEFFTILDRQKKVDSIGGSLAVDDLDLALLLLMKKLHHQLPSGVMPASFPEEFSHDDSRSRYHAQ